MNDQNMFDNEILVEAIRPERKTGWFGKHKAELNPPPLKEGALLFLRTQSVMGEPGLRTIRTVDDPITVAPADWALFLRVHAKPAPMTLEFPALALDAKGWPLDVILEGTWQVSDARSFLQSIAAAMVAPDRPLRSSDLQLLVATRIRRLVCDIFTAEAKGHTFEQLRSAQVLPPAWWQNRLDEWLSEFGLLAQLTNARLACCEADQQITFQRQLNALEQLSQRGAMLHEAMKQFAEQDLQHAQHDAEQQIASAKMQADAAVAVEAINCQLADYRNACLNQRIDADEKVHQAIRNAAEAAQKHLLEMAKLNGQIADAELARLKREQKAKLDLLRYEAEQNLIITRLNAAQEAIRRVMAELEKQSAHAARLWAQRCQWEYDEQKEDLAAISKEKAIDRQTLIQIAQNRLTQAQREAAEAEERSNRAQEVLTKPLETPCPYPHCRLDLAIGQTFTCARCHNTQHVWHKSAAKPDLCDVCATVKGGRRRWFAGVAAALLLASAAMCYWLWFAPVTLFWAGWGQRQMPDGSWQDLPLRDGITLTASNQFKLKFQVGRDCHAYVVVINADGAVSRLFPPDDHSRVRAGVEYTVPEGTSWATLDDQPGAEILLLIASLRRRADIAAFALAQQAAWATNNPGTRNVLIGPDQRVSQAAGRYTSATLADGRQVRRLMESAAARGTTVKRIQINHESR